MKIDPHHHEPTYRRWKKKTVKAIPGITARDSRTIKIFLADMERGLNTGNGTQKGPRSFARLNTLRHRLTFLARNLHARCGRRSMLLVREEELIDFFAAMRGGEIKKQDGQPYRSTADYVKVFKSFWHWHMKVQRKRGTLVSDICVDLDTSQKKPSWVYLTEADVSALCRAATPEYRALMLFLFDSGIRAPTELVNVRVCDLLDDCTRLRIRDDSSKTFGRTVNLLLSPDLIRHYLRDAGRGPSDQVFPINPAVVNRYLKRLGSRVLGNRQSLAGGPYSRTTMYDFRHSSACYWLPRYKSESALKYRFGWRRSEMIHYYTELLGMKDTITEGDLHLAPGRTALENRLAKVEAEKRLAEEKLESLQEEVREILRVVKRLSSTPEVRDTATPRAAIESSKPNRKLNTRISVA